MSLKRKAADLAAAEAKKPKANGSITSFFGAPKPKPVDSTTGAAAAPRVKFDKDAWVKTLSDEQKELLKLEIDTLHESWLAHLKDEVVTSDFLNLKRFLKGEISAGKKIFPPLEDVYSWYVMTVLKLFKKCPTPQRNHRKCQYLSPFSYRIKIEMKSKTHLEPGPATHRSTP